MSLNLGLGKNPRNVSFFLRLRWKLQSSDSHQFEVGNGKERTGYRPVQVFYRVHKGVNCGHPLKFGTFGTGTFSWNWGEAFVLCLVSGNRQEMSWVKSSPTLTRDERGLLGSCIQTRKSEWHTHRSQNWRLGRNPPLNWGNRPSLTFYG